MSRKALCPAWRMPRFPIMRRVSPSGVLPLCLDQAAIGRHNHEDRVWLICEQDDGSEQPAPLESAEIGNAPEEPSDDGEAPASVGEVGTAVGTIMVVGASDPPLVSASVLAYSGPQ